MDRMCPDKELAFFEVKHTMPHLQKCIYDVNISHLGTNLNVYAYCHA